MASVPLGQSRPRSRGVLQMLPKHTAVSRVASIRASGSSLQEYKWLEKQRRRPPWQLNIVFTITSGHSDKKPLFELFLSLPCSFTSHVSENDGARTINSSLCFAPGASTILYNHML